MKIVPQPYCGTIAMTLCHYIGMDLKIILVKNTFGEFGYKVDDVPNSGLPTRVYTTCLLF